MKHLNSNLLIVLITLITIISGCSSSTNDHLVLEIGTFNYTSQQYQILFNKEFNQLLDEKKKISKRFISTWQEDLINRSLVLADAKKMKLENDPEINKQVEDMASQIITQNGGLLFQKCVSDKVIVTDDMVNEAIDKLQYVYQIEVLQFRNKEALMKYTGNKGFLNSLEQFRELSDISNGDIEYGLRSWNWLSPGFLEARDSIVKMNSGDITGPLYNSQRPSIYHIKKKELNPKWEQVKSDKKSIIPILKSVYTQKLAGELDSILYNKAAIKLFYENIHILWNIIKEDEQDKLNEEKYFKIKDSVIMTYLNDGQTISLHAIDFIRIYNKLMIRQAISSENTLIYYIKDIPWKKQAMLMADDLNITKEIEFVTEKEDYKNRLIINKYLELKNKKLVNISDEEVLDEYEKTIEKYNKGEYVVASLFYFNSSDAAFSARSLIQSGEWQQDTNLVLKYPDLKRARFHRKIYFQSKDFDNPFLSRLFNADNGSVEFFNQTNNNLFLLAFKENLIGERYLSLEQVSGPIRNSIYSKRLLETKKLLIDSLKKEYKIIENFPEN